MHYFDSVRKKGGDNADPLYQGASINGTDNYKISGNRGTVAFFAVTALETGAPPPGVARWLAPCWETISRSTSTAIWNSILAPNRSPATGSSRPARIPIACPSVSFTTTGKNERRMEARIKRLGPPAALEDFTILSEIELK